MMPDGELGGKQRLLTCEDMFINLKSPFLPEMKEVRMRFLSAVIVGLLMFAAFFANGPTARAEDGSAASPQPTQTMKERPGTAERLLSIYRDHISAVDGDRCPSYPTCSSYSVQAFKKHGLVMGWLMTVDRLIHEGKEEAAVSPRILSDGKLKIYDPVENNDFWWHRSEHAVQQEK